MVITQWAERRVGSSRSSPWPLLAVGLCAKALASLSYLVSDRVEVLANTKALPVLFLYLNCAPTICTNMIIEYERLRKVNRKFQVRVNESITTFLTSHPAGKLLPILQNFVSRYQ